jgi:hypothetical protein
MNPRERNTHIDSKHTYHDVENAFVECTRCQPLVRHSANARSRAAIPLVAMLNASPTVEATPQQAAKQWRVGHMRYLWGGATEEFVGVECVLVARCTTIFLIPYTSNTHALLHPRTHTRTHAHIHALIPIPIHLIRSVSCSSVRMMLAQAATPRPCRR